MGAAYRATDIRLNRDVAIKSLPRRVRRRPGPRGPLHAGRAGAGIAQPPNLASIYGVEERVLVLELVEGRTLAARITHGSIPVDESLPIARQFTNRAGICDRVSIIDRNLKPVNLKVIEDDTVNCARQGMLIMGWVEAARSPHEIQVEYEGQEPKL